MQLITPFPCLVALADPRSACAGACTHSTRAPAKTKEPSRRRSQRADVHSQQEFGVTAISATSPAVFCEELCEIGRGWKSPDDARAYSCSRQCIVILYFTQRPQQIGFAISHMKHNAHAHYHSRASRYPNGGMGSPASYASRLGPAHHGWALRAQIQLALNYCLSSPHIPAPTCRQPHGLERLGSC